MDISDGIFGLSLSVIFGSLVTSFRLWSKDQREKGEMAVNMLIEWSNHSDITTDRCVSLADENNLERHEVDMIWRKQPCTISYKGKQGLLALMKEIFDDVDYNKSKKELNLNYVQVSVIVFYWSNYLNRLEFMLAAWTNNLADKDIMSTQLSVYLKLRKDRLNLLMTNHIEDCFPNIVKFQNGCKPNRRLGWFQTGPLSRTL